MLVLARKPEQGIVLTGPGRVVVVRASGSRVHLGIEAPDSTRVLRDEMQDSGGARPHFTDQDGAGTDA